MADSNGTIDEGLYSRQIYVLGLESLQMLSKMSVLVVGLSGLGVEVAKNLVLAGPRSVTVHDSSAATWLDLSAQFYLTEQDVHASTPRARASAPRLAQLNPYVQVVLHEGALDDAFLQQFQVVVACNVDGALAERLDDFCHAHGVGFVRGDARGPFARLFVDFGPAFVVRDTDGQAKEEYIVTGISNSNPAVVTVVADDERQLQRFLDSGNEVELREVQGMGEANGCRGVVRLLTKQSLELGGVDSTGWARYVTGGVLREVKKPRTMAFKRMAESRRAPGEFQMEDWSKWGRSQQMHALFQALDDARDLPASAEDGVALAAAAAAYMPAGETVDGALAAKVAALCRGTLAPVCAFLGGVVAQEVLKYTGKFTPCQQWAYVDCLDVVPEPLPDDRQPLRHDRYDGQRWVFGEAMQQSLGSLKVFMVGAGALGCELLKGLAGMGACVEPHGGSLAVTDMDTIEKSNLNRQFLFRDTDIGQPKSFVACRAAASMNSQLRLQPFNIPVGPDTEATFGQSFWSSLDVAINALDTWAARLYVDSRCVEFGKPLLESGTLGATGHTQVVVPHTTLNFGATRIQKEVAVPSCTIHHFPHSIHHTLTWAREQFDTLFVSSAEDTNRHLADPHAYLAQLLDRMPPAGKVEVLRRLLRVRGLQQRLLQHGPLAECVREARRMFEEWFCADIKQLLVTHPANALDEDGGPFWAPPRRAPVPIEFNINDALHVGFVSAAAALLAHRHGLESRAVVRSLVQTELSGAFVEALALPSCGGDDTREAAYLATLMGVGSTSNDNNAPQLAPLRVAKFEKDDDTNSHVDFVHSVANLRAINYGITPIERLEAKKIAGNIVPAMVTTTGAITGLVLMQLYLLVQRPAVPMERYREANLDLATNLLAFAEPQPCGVTRATPHFCTVPRAGFTLWDTLAVRLGDCTVQKLGAWLATEHGCSLKAVSCEGMALFRASDPKTRDARAKSKVTDIYVQLRGGAPIPPHKYRLVLALMAVDKATELDVEFPTVAFLWKDEPALSAAPKKTGDKTKKKRKVVAALPSSEGGHNGD